MSKFIEIEVDVVATTEKAIGVDNGKETVWIPRSQIDDYCEEDGQITSIFITEWLATEKGLV